ILHCRWVRYGPLAIREAKLLRQRLSLPFRKPQLLRPALVLVFLSTPYGLVSLLNRSRLRLRTTSRLRGGSRRSSGLSRRRTMSLRKPTIDFIYSPLIQQSVELLPF